MQNQSNPSALFKRNIEILAHSRGFRDVFTDLLDFAIHCLTLRDDAKLLRNPLDSYIDRDKDLFLEAFNQIGSIMEDFTDAFGDIFMEYLSYGKNGQFFTPQPICDMMAQMTMGTDTKPGMSVCDCACGSGRTLLAAAKINRNMIFVGSDIDLTCVKMAVVNLAYNSLIGEVAWMNTLSLEHYASFHIKVEPISRIPYILITGKDDSLQLPKLKFAIQDMPAHQKQQVSNQTYLFD